MKIISYKEWYKTIRFLNNKIILSDGTIYSKDKFTTDKGFNTEEFNNFLKELYVKRN
jgi:hypothetical protein